MDPTSTQERHPFAGVMAAARHDVTDPGLVHCDAGSFRLPVTYRNARTFIGTFPARLDRLGSLLPQGLRPRRMYGSWGGLVIQFVDAPDTSLGSYRECAIGIAVHDREAKVDPGYDLLWDPPACHSLWLSVTTELACQCGQAVWGYPKTTGDVVFDVLHSRLDARVAMDGRSVVSCAGGWPGDSARGKVRLRSVTRKGGRMLENSIFGEASWTLTERPDLRVHVDGCTPIAEALRALEPEPDALSCAYLSNFDYELSDPNSSATRAERHDARR